MQRHFDVVVIGAGPAGLSAGAELIARGRTVLVVDQGPHADTRRRKHEDDVLSGVGGAGLFSDGKLSFAPAASGVWALPGVEVAYGKVAAMLAGHGVAAPDLRKPGAAPEGGEAWATKGYESIYVSFERRLAIIQSLREACDGVESRTRVTSVMRDSERFVVALEVDGVSEVVHAKHVVVATGRFSPRWIRNWLETCGAKYDFRYFEFGVRLEGDNTHPLFAKLPGVDGKMRFVDAAVHGEIRTFATCRDGEVVVGHADGIRAFSGRSDCPPPPTEQSNVGLIVRTFHRALAKEILQHVDRSTPTSLPLATWLRKPGLLDPVFGAAGTHAALHAVKRLAAWEPALEKGITVHAPVVEAIGEFPVVDNELRLAPNLWLAGDSTGRFRGIVAAMVSGRYIASKIT